MGARLRMAGIDDFTIFERGETVGGVWRANTYPGAACDVPSHLYSFSFAPGHNWSSRFAPQAEILAYMEEIVEDFGLAPHLRLGTEAESASFDEASGRWTLRHRRRRGARVRRPRHAPAASSPTRDPEIPGREEFAGRAFHSAEWDHEHDLSGQRRRGDRHRRERDPVRPADRAAGEAA